MTDNQRPQNEPLTTTTDNDIIINLCVRTYIFTKDSKDSCEKMLFWLEAPLPISSSRKEIPLPPPPPRQEFRARKRNFIGFLLAFDTLTVR